jgi:hypothetical protein
MHAGPSHSVLVRWRTPEHSENQRDPAGPRGRPLLGQSWDRTRSVGNPGASVERAEIPGPGSC